MSTEIDAAEFVDTDFQPTRKSPFAAPAPAAAGTPGDPSRAATREEVDGKVGEMQQKLAELKRVQNELERERAALEETRRRQQEFTTGRQEMVQHLTRGVGLLEQAEFAHRRDAEQLARQLVELRAALNNVQGIQEDAWTKNNFNSEISRALTVIENARLEWNSARLKFPVLEGALQPEPAAAAPAPVAAPPLLGARSYAELCKLGLAITWPLALLGLLHLVVMLLRR